MGGEGGGGEKYIFTDIHQELILTYDDNTFTISDDSSITCKFEAFKSVPMDTVLALIRPSSGKSCHLDPLLGSLLQCMCMPV